LIEPPVRVAPEAGSGAHGAAHPAAARQAPALDPCEICRSTAVVERRCKVVCLNCRTILKSCADL
jgi:hypothetical protein